MRTYTFERNNLSDLEKALNNFLRDINDDRVFSVQYASTISMNPHPYRYSDVVILKEN